MMQQPILGEDMGTRKTFARVWRLIAFFAVFSSLLAAQSVQGRRVALVIGNAAYEGEDRLANSVNDAKDVAAALGKAGFELTVRTDANLETMVNAVDEFTGKTCQGAQAALFFYAGHGIQVKGENYLIPVNVKFEGLSEVMLQKSAQSVQEILNSMEAARTPMNLIIIDACRTNPWGSRGGTRAVPGARGFASMESVPRGSYILFASEPGKPALDNPSQRNGAFTGVFLRHMLTPGLEFKDLVSTVASGLNEETKGKQVPYPSGILLDKFYLVPPNSEQNRAVPLSPTGPSDTNPIASVGGISVTSLKAGIVRIDGVEKGRIKEGGSKTFPGIESGKTELRILYEDGSQELLSVMVKAGSVVEAAFTTPPKPQGIESSFAKIDQKPAQSASQAPVPALSGSWKGTLVEITGMKRTFTFLCELAYDEAKKSLKGSSAFTSEGYEEKHTLTGSLQGNKVFLVDENQRYLWGTFDETGIKGAVSWSGYEKDDPWGEWTLKRAAK
jgi:hypothetical protein